MHNLLFGGAFDPPHLGHFQVVKSILEEDVADQVWLIPAGQHPFAKKMSPDDQRLKMLHLSFDHAKFKDRLRYETYELDKQGVGYSYETLRHFATKYPTDTFSWVIGSDNLTNFSKWGFYQQLLDEFTVYVYPRKGFALTPLLPGMVILTEVPEVDVSSTDIKRRVAQGYSLKDLVVPAVEQYIIEEKLYR